MSSRKSWSRAFAPVSSPRRRSSRTSDQIVDSVTAQDIGALPDRSVSEALQRIPGITLQRTNENRDPARLASEGGGVFIRGLSWVRSETNGRDIFSANSGRDLSFEDVSADLLAGVDVYKNPSAEIIEGGIGGIVNLRTRLPFDSDKQQFAVSARLQLRGSEGRGLRLRQRALQQSLGNGRRRIRRAVLAQLRQHRQSHRQHPDRAASSRATAMTMAGRHAAAPRCTSRTPSAGAGSTGSRSARRLRGRVPVRAHRNDHVDAAGPVRQGHPEGHRARVRRRRWQLPPPTAPRTRSMTMASSTGGTLANVKADGRHALRRIAQEDVRLFVQHQVRAERPGRSASTCSACESHADVVSMTAFTQLGSCNNPATACSLDFDLRGDTPGLAVPPGAEPVGGSGRRTGGPRRWITSKTTTRIRPPFAPTRK